MKPQVLLLFASAVLSGILPAQVPAARDTTSTVSEAGPAVSGFLLGDAPATLYFDFDSSPTTDNGLDSDSWTDLMGQSFPSTQVFSGVAPGGRATGGYANGSGNQDSSHPTLVMSSPAFELVPEMAMSFLIAGGEGSAATAPANLSLVPATSNSSGFQGVALRRISDNAYLLSARRAGNANTDQVVRFTRAQIDAVRLANPGQKFTLDWIDYDDTNWGFASLDDVSVTVGTAGGNVPLVSPPTQISGAPGWSSTLAGMLSDTFDYQPTNPTSSLPDQVFNGADGYHNSTAGDVVIVFNLVTPLTVDATKVLAFDLYGRPANPDRDDNLDVEFLDASDVLLGQLTGLAIPSGTAHLRVYSDAAGVANGSTIAKIRVTGHDADTDALLNLFTLMEVRAAAMNADYYQAYLAGGTTTLGLATPTVLVGVVGYGSTLVGTVNDPFAYNPINPTAALPNQNFNANAASGFHNQNTNTDATLLFGLTTPTAVNSTTSIAVDLYGRADCCWGRDNNIDIAFLDASNVVLGELFGQIIPDAAPYHLRVSSAGVVTTGTVAKIRVTGHDSEAPTNVSNSFALMEMRAAKVVPGIPARTVIAVNGVAGNVGSQFTLLSGALLTVTAGGKFTYDPNGAFTVTGAPVTDTFDYTMGYGTATTSVGTVTVSITDADSVIYVDDDFASLTIDDLITDADLGTAGDQGATYGTDAFATMGAATAAAAPGSTIIVNAGSYAEAVGLGLGTVLEVDSAVTFSSLGVSGGAMVAGRTGSSLVITASASVAGDGSAISLADGASLDSPVTGLSTGGGLALGGSATCDAGAVNFSGTGSIALDGTSVLTINSGTVGVAVTGTGSVEKNTTGDSIFTVASSFQGGTTINAGRVRFSGAGSLGTGDVTVNDGGQLYLTVNLANDVAIRGLGWTEGAGALGAIRFENNITLTGDVTVDPAGARIVAYSGAAGSINGALLGNGNLEINIVATALANGTVSLLGSGASFGATVTVSRGRFNMGSALGGSVVVENAGALGNEGAIAGNLQLGSTGGSGATLVIDAATFAVVEATDVTLNGISNLTVVNNLTPGVPEDILSYSGTLTDGNGGTLTDSFAISGGGALRAASVTDNSGTLQLGGANVSMVWTADTSDNWQIGGPQDNWSSSDGFFFNGDSVTFDDTVNPLFSGTITAVGTPLPAAMIFNNSTVPYAIVGAIGGTGDLVKNGNGTVSLASQHSFTGGTIINNGVLDLTGGGGVNGTIRGTVTVYADGILADGILRASSGDVTGYGNTPASLQTINLEGGEFNINTVSNQTLGNATINMTGGMITGVAGSNLDFFQGNSTINVLESPDPSVISGTTIKLRQTGGLTITVEDGTATDDLIVDSVIRYDTGFTDNNLTKAGPGKMVLNATNTYPTKTIINEGILSLRLPTAIPDANTVDLNGSAVLDLDFTGVEVIDTLNIDGSPVADGIYGATGSGALIIDNTHFTGTGRLLVGALPYDTWEAFYSIVGAGPLANSDGDPSNNLLEFAFGTNPTVSDGGALDYDGVTVTPGSPAIHTVFPGGGGVDFTARFLRRKDHGVPGSVSYTVRFSADLTVWESSTETPTVVADAGDYELVEIPYPFFVGGEKARFFQVVVTDL